VVDAEDRHRRGRDLRRGGQPSHGLDRDRDRDADREQHRGLGGGAEDLRAPVPPVRLAVAGRSARVAATRRMTSPAVSVSACPASASSVRLPDRIAPITSATSTVAVSASTMPSRPRLPPAPWSCPCAWPRAHRVHLSPRVF